MTTLLALYLTHLNFMIVGKQSIVNLLKSNTYDNQARAFTWQNYGQDPYEYLYL